MPIVEQRRTIVGEVAMLGLGAEIADWLSGRLRGSGLVRLEGDLGAGKTTLARGILRGLGFEGAVKSPTYTIVEPYEFSGKRVYHFDFYRIADPQELDFIGLDELLEDSGVKLVEWPDRAGDRLPDADATIRIAMAGAGRHVVIEENHDRD